MATDLLSAAWILDESRATSPHCCYVCFLFTLDSGQRVSKEKNEVSLNTNSVGLMSTTRLGS